MKILENIINKKISTITGDELLTYAKQFNIAVTEQQSVLVATYLNENKVNIFDDRERVKLIKEIAKIAGPKVAREINQLFIQFSTMQ